MFKFALIATATAIKINGDAPPAAAAPTPTFIMDVARTPIKAALTNQQKIEALITNDDIGANPDW